MDELTREQFGIPAPGRCGCLDRHDPQAGIEPRSYSLLATADPHGYPHGYPQATVDGPGPWRPRVIFTPQWGRGHRRPWLIYGVRRAKKEAR